MKDALYHREGDFHIPTERSSGFMGFLQVALGILLITASAFGYSLMQHAALLIPAIMGAAPLFYGLKAVQVCRSRSVSDNHQHQRNGAMG